MKTRVYSFVVYSIKQLGEHIQISDILITHWHVGGLDNVVLSVHKTFPQEVGPHHQKIFHQINNSRRWFEEENAFFTGDSVLEQGATVFNDLTLYYTLVTDH